MVETTRMDKQTFRQGFDEAVTITDWVELVAGSEEELERFASHADAGEDGVFVERGPLLPYHWMNRELYEAYGKEMWAIGRELAFDLGDANPLKMLAWRTESQWVHSWEDVIDQLVTRVLAFIAGGLQGDEP